MGQLLATTREHFSGHSKWQGGDQRNPINLSLQLSELPA
jgi:hypothetical protein